VCDLETSRICTPYIYDIRSLKVKQFYEFCSIFNVTPQIYNDFPGCSVGLLAGEEQGGRGSLQGQSDLRFWLADKIFSDSLLEGVKNSARFSDASRRDYI
jgi:hypothetical protein